MMGGVIWGANIIASIRAAWGKAMEAARRSRRPALPGAPATPDVEAPAGEAADVQLPAEGSVHVVLCGQEASGSAPAGTKVAGA
jgi:hypothetical protein